MKVYVVFNSTAHGGGPGFPCAVLTQSPGKLDQYKGYRLRVQEFNVDNGAAVTAAPGQTVHLMMRQELDQPPSVDAVFTSACEGKGDRDLLGTRPFTLTEKLTETLPPKTPASQGFLRDLAHAVALRWF